MKTKRQLKKPVRDFEAVEAFAEAPTTPVKGHIKAKAAQGIADTEKSPLEATKDAKFRLTMNISKDIHIKLKIAAAKQGATMTELLEKLVTEHLDD